MPHSRGEKRITAAACLLTAALLMLLCSQSSPIYPINLWDDANCLLTVGRVMRAGGVLYRDIYEQKGPTLYLAHMLAACVSDRSFLGVYLVETLCAAAAMFFAARLLRNRLSPGASISIAAICGALVYVSPAFQRGDSAEEFCLPFLAAAVYIALANRRDAPLNSGKMLACGLFAGIVATVKYTALGLFVGLCLAEGALALQKGGLRRAMKSAAAFLIGMVLPVAAWCIYFAAHGALRDFFTAYVYNNIFLYDAGAPAQAAAIDALRLARDNAIFLVPAVLGVAALAAAGKGFAARIGAPLLFAGTLAGALAGHLWPYCLLPLGALLPAGALGICRVLSRLRSDVKRRFGQNLTVPRRAACAAALALALGVAWFLSPNAFLRFTPLSELAQGRLAAHIPEGASLLQYSHLDDGLYLTSGALPQGRFFVRLNVRYPEMLEALDGYVARGEPDYVLVSWRELPEEFTRYALIAQDTAYDDAGRLNKALYLYGRKGE